MQRLEAIGIDPKFTKGKWKEKVGREGKWGKRKKKKKKKKKKKEPRVKRKTKKKAIPGLPVKGTICYLS
jgi:hypothetical protein